MADPHSHYLTSQKDLLCRFLVYKPTSNLEAPYTKNGSGWLR